MALLFVHFQHFCRCTTQSKSEFHIRVFSFLFETPRTVWKWSLCVCRHMIIARTPQTNACVCVPFLNKNAFVFLLLTGQSFVGNALIHSLCLRWAGLSHRNSEWTWCCNRTKTLTQSPTTSDSNTNKSKTCSIQFVQNRNINCNCVRFNTRSGLVPVCLWHACCSQLGSQEDKQQSAVGSVRCFFACPWFAALVGLKTHMGILHLSFVRRLPLTAISINKQNDNYRNKLHAMLKFVVCRAKNTLEAHACTAHSFKFALAPIFFFFFWRRRDEEKHETFSSHLNLWQKRVSSLKLVVCVRDAQFFHIFFRSIVGLNQTALPFYTNQCLRHVLFIAIFWLFLSSSCQASHFCAVDFVCAIYVSKSIQSRSKVTTKQWSWRSLSHFACLSNFCFHIGMK